MNTLQFLRDYLKKRLDLISEILLNKRVDDL